MPYIVPDTNFFLQCQSIDALDWSLVTDMEEFTLAIPRTVQREIDKHKGGGNARRASRARATASLFAQILDADASGFSIKGRGVIISACLLSPRLNAYSFPDLNLDEPDERIVAEAMWLSSQHPSDSVTLVTGDTPVMVTARSLNVPYKRMPDEWLLKPEPDPKDKKIGELERRIQVLEQDTPVLQFSNEGGPYDFEVTHYEPLDDDAIDELIRHAEKLAPMRTDFSLGAKPSVRSGRHTHIAMPQLPLGVGLKAPLAHDIDHYQTVEYPKWIDDMREKLATIHEWLNREASSVSVTLSNNGNKPATGLLVEAQLEGNLLFVGAEPANEDEGDDQLAPIPSPPAPPKMRSMFDAIARPQNISKQIHDYLGRDWAPGVHKHVAPKDPEAFYIDPSRQTPRRLSYVCEVFRHRHDAQKFTFGIRPAAVEGDTCAGAMRVTAHASNVPMAVEDRRVVKFVIGRGDTIAEARLLVEACVRKVAKEYGIW